MTARNSLRTFDNCIADLNRPEPILRAPGEFDLLSEFATALQSDQDDRNAPVFEMAAALREQEPDVEPRNLNMIPGGLS